MGDCWETLYLNLPKAIIDVSSCSTPPNEDQNNSRLNPKGFLQMGNGGEDVL